VRRVAEANKPRHHVLPYTGLDADGEPNWDTADIWPGDTVDIVGPDGFSLMLKAAPDGHLEFR
jgi:hypothetical protein